MGDNSVYVSYSWSAEQDQPLATEIGEALRAAGLDFRRDVERIGYGDSIKKFMGELGAAGNIVAVLSSAYFRSENCMYELLSVWHKGQFSKRIHPVRLDELRLDDDRLQKEIIGYWENKASEMLSDLTRHSPGNTLDLQERARLCSAICRDVGCWMALIADMNSLALTDLRGQRFAQLIERIRSSVQIQPGADLSSFRKNDGTYLQELETKISVLLDGHIDLRNALRKYVRLTFPDVAVDAIKTLAYENMTSVIDDVLRPAVEETLCKLDSTSDAYGKVWEAAKELLERFLPFAVDPAWIAEREQFGQLSNIDFAVMVDTQGGVEMVSARFRQMKPNLRAEPGKADVYGEHAIACPPLPITGYDEDNQLRELLLGIWLRIFPDESRVTLSPKDMKKLNVALARIERKKLAHYYIPVEADVQTPLLRREFYEKLVKELPSMTVIYLNATAGRSPFRVPDEIDFVDAIRSFLLLPDTLRKTRH